MTRYGNMFIQKFNIELEKGGKKVAFNYSKLLGKIVEVFGTQLRFSEAMGLSERTISLKLNSRVEWKQSEITKACRLLDINISEIPIYFFAA